MPYNSSSFEKHLARYKNEQAAKSVAKMPLVPEDDPHRPRAKTIVDRGRLVPSPGAYAGVNETLEAASRSGPSGEGFEGGFEGPIIIRRRKKPFYLRGWVLFLAFSVLSTAAMPVFFKDQMDDLLGMAGTIKESTGIDPLALKTYTDMAAGKTPQAAEPLLPAPASPAKEGAPPVAAVAVPDMPTVNDMHALVDKAGQKAAEVTTGGPDSSMRYIDQETRRLQTMAREYDEKYGRTGE